MKYVYLFLSIMFVLFAVLQYNDPDPYLWGPYYLAIAVICFLQFRSQRQNWLIYSALLLTLIWLISYVPDIIEYFKNGRPNIASEMKATTPYIENMRESGGLFICLVTLLVILVKGKKLTIGNKQ